jgi:hypothetical protein
MGHHSGKHGCPSTAARTRPTLNRSGGPLPHIHRLTTVLLLADTGIASALYQSELQPNSKIAVSVEFDATNLNALPRYGVALDIKS